MIDVLLALLGFVALSAIAAAVGAEFLGWLPVLVRALVGLAVHRLPPEHQERYREEFLHDIDHKAQGRKLTALVWAVWICVAAGGIGRDLDARPARDRGGRAGSKWSGQERTLVRGTPLVAASLAFTSVLSGALYGAIGSFLFGGGWRAIAIAIGVMLLLLAAGLLRMVRYLRGYPDSDAELEIRTFPLAIRISVRSSESDDGATT